MNTLEQIRQQCADELDALSYFDDLPVLIEDRKDTPNALQRAMGALKGEGGKVGAFVLFVTESASVTRDSEFGPVFNNVDIAIQCVEQPEINRYTQNGTTKTAWDIACQVAAALILFKPDSANSPLVMRDPSIDPILFKFQNSEKLLPGWQVNMTVAGSLAILKDQIGTPVIERDGDDQSPTYKEVALSCATPGAAIFYTVDGKKPGTNKTLYTAPFTPPDGVMLKVRAWLSGFIASEIASLQIPA